MGLLLQQKVVIVVSVVCVAIKKTSSGILFIIKNLEIQDCLLLLNSRLGENIYKICVSLPDYAVTDTIHIEIFRTKT